jgi:TolA-binding protein
MVRFLTSLIRGAGLVVLCVGISCLESLAAPATVSDPDNAHAAEVVSLYNAAMQAFTEGKWAAAAEGFEKVLSMLIDPQAQLKLGHVHYTLGAAYFNAANYPKALESFRTFLTKYPQDARAGEARMGIARATFLNRDFAGALKLFAELEGVPALREMSLSAQAECYKELGQADGQIQTLEKLIAPEIKNGVQATGAMTLMEAYAATGELEKALRLVNLLYAKVGLLDNVLALNVATVKLGDAMAEKQAFPQAIAAYQAVRSRDQVIAFQKDRLAAMDRRMRAALEAARGNPQAYVAAVNANREIEARQAEAKKLLAEIEKLPDHAPAVLIRTAKAWYDWEKRWEAIVAFERLKTEFPDAKEAEMALYSQIICYGDLNRPQRTLRLCDEYLGKYPNGASAATVGYLKGAAALQNNDPKSAVTYFGTMLEKQPESEFREQMRFLLGNSHFMQGQYAEARKEYQRYAKDFPKGSSYEEAVYRNALTLIFEGTYEPALAAFNAYLEQFKGGTFAPDGRYRVMVCKYAGSLYDEIIADADAWQRDFPNHEMTGEVMTLLGDALAAQDKTAEAAEAYTKAYKAATTDEVLNYALFEAGQQLQKLGQWPEVARMFEEFVREKPDHPAVVAAMFWIGKAKSRTGQPEAAKTFLIENLKRYLNDPKREAVEQLLEQLAQLCSKRPRASAPASETAPAGATPSATSVPAATPPPYDALAELKKQLAPLEADANATGQARLLYAQAQLFKLTKREPEAQRIYGEIAAGFKSTQLSPVLLAVTGDHLLSKGDQEKAAKFYADLREDYPKSNYLDYAYVGLGEMALAKGRFKEALELFTHATDEIAGAKMKEATIGKARAQLELGLLADAKKGFEQVASIREWRGETTAQAVYYLGEVEARQAHWAEAIAHYQRVFVAYQKYLPWAAKAYVRSAECFEKMGKRTEAIGHLKEMLRNERLRDFVETKQADRMLADWGAAG